MPDPDDYDDNDDQDGTGQSGQPNWRRKLEADAKAGREAIARAEAAEAEKTAAQRELALARLGIDTSSGPGKLFAKAYDGEITVDAMRSAAEEYGVLTPPQQQGQQQLTPADQQALQRIQQASNGGAASGGAAHDFEAELDQIPLMTKDGQYNPEYVNQVLAATAVQAAREGRQFVTSGGQITAQKGFSLAGPATTPIAG